VVAQAKDTPDQSEATNMDWPVGSVGNTEAVSTKDQTLAAELQGEALLAAVPAISQQMARMREMSQTVLNG
jgi:hypothetical protein